MTDLTVVPSDLRSTADQVVAQATAAVDQVIATTLAVATTAQSWGDDELGQAFAGVYLTPAAETMEAVQQVAFQIADVAERLRSSADGYDATEESNVVESDTVAGEVAP